MKHSSAIFHLNVQQVESVCLFELTWGSGQRECARVAYPSQLMRLYQTWKNSYLNFYQHYPPTASLPASSDLRGRTVSGGILTINQDWQAQLVEAKATLLHEFHRWLLNQDLHPIWTKLAQATRQIESEQQTLDLLLTCTPIDLIRLPWEAWDINSQFATKGTIRIARVPGSIHQESVRQQAKIRHRPRVLAILGGGVDAEVDRQRMELMNRQITDVTILSQRPNQSQKDWKAEVVSAIQDKRGWEMLFFAGHSRETEMTGGALELAPGASIQMSELEQHLAIAQQNGLQFAIFNSCSGIPIAETLIKLGVSQVIVIRERIHNHVAQEFLVKFLEAFGKFKDVHDCMISACNYLKLEKDIAYPSGYLVPSLFRHPGAKLFQIHPSVRRKFFKWIYEAVTVTAIVSLSGTLPVQDYLLANRLLQQSWYRNITTQTATGTFPVLMVTVDQESLKRAKIQHPNPIDRKYLASLVDKLTRLKAKVIGIDYLLDRDQPSGDLTLSKAVQEASAQGTHLMFAADCEGKAFPGCENWLRPSPQLKLPEGTPLGDVRFLSNGTSASYYVPYWEQKASEPTPFADQLAQLYKQVFNSQRSPQPQIQPSVITQVGYALGQMWLHPIVDFSLPPDSLYEQIPAWALLEGSDNALQNLQVQQVVMIVPGGYAEAGIQAMGQDNYPLPAATRYWRLQQKPTDLREQLIGSELHAYFYHHFLTQRAITPIPDLWLVLLAIAAGKTTVFLIQRRSPQRRTVLYLLMGGTLVYTIISVQMYVSIAVLIPIVLPISLYWLYAFPSIIHQPK